MGDQNSCEPFRPSTQVTSCAQQGQHMIECGQNCQDKPKKSGKSRAAKCQKKKAKESATRRRWRRSANSRAASANREVAMSERNGLLRSREEARELPGAGKAPSLPVTCLYFARTAAASSVTVTRDCRFEVCVIPRPSHDHS